MDIDVRTTTHEHVPVMHVSGEVDHFTCERVRRELTALIDGGHARVVVDLNGVRFIDSTGLGALVGARKRAAARGTRLALVVAPDGDLLRLLRVSRLSHLFVIHPTLEEGLQAA